MQESELQRSQEGKENLGSYQLQTIIKAMELSEVKAVAAETKPKD